MHAQVSAQELPSGATDLDALDRFLRSDSAPPNCMMLSELDGFLWGIAVGPERILASEWMPHVCGGEAPTFADQQDGQTFLDLISTRYNEILHNVARDVVDPIFWTDRDGKITAADWVEGFRQAIVLRPDAWKPLIVSEYARFLMVPIFALCRNQEGKTGLDLPPEREQRFVENATELIPACVNRIAKFWREGGPRRTSAPFAARPPSGPGRTPAKVGRNDPCPCGSGKKFKKCCGRNT